MPTTPPPDWVYYVSGVLLLLGNLAAWFGTLFMMPGNWIIVALAALAAYFLPVQESGLGFGWAFVAVLGGLALFGEFVEFFGSASKAKQYGASRRAMVLSIIGAMLGATLGGTIGWPLGPIGGVALIIILGGAGAFAGTYLGETWKGRPRHERFAVSRAALFGRLFGTAGKLIVGMVMVCLTAMASFYF
ncbi:MAG: DUF456 domain-containing protein [Planctomycetaceae bacterium]